MRLAVVNLERRRRQQYFIRQTVKLYKGKEIQKQTLHELHTDTPLPSRLDAVRADYANREAVVDLKANYAKLKGKSSTDTNT